MDNKLIIKLESYIDDSDMTERVIITINDKIVSHEYLASIKAKLTSDVITDAIKNWCSGQFEFSEKEKRMMIEDDKNIKLLSENVKNEGISAKELVEWADKNGLKFADPSDIPVE
jgi:PBP1b-binding outer membrane lipoprotein LpoB